jgi:probable rRNA maturation factor
LSLVFDYTDTEIGLRVPGKFKGIIREIEENEDKKLGEICFIFVNRKRILEINRDFLKHDYATDVITFSNNIKRIIKGEIYICIDVVLKNAQNLGISFEKEVQRVMIHGILHLLDYSDAIGEEIKKMREREDFYLAVIERDGFWNDGASI